MHVSPHLTFAGHCEAAFQFYARTLGGTIGTMLTYGQSPMVEQVRSDWHSKIVHASLSIGDTMLTGADALPEQYVPPQGFYVLLGVDEPAEAERVFRALAEGGDVRLPIQETFWSPRFGVLVDRFGIPWEISGEQAPATMR
jgi:PhnB protein